MTTAAPERPDAPALSTGEEDIRQYINEIRQFPRLTPEEERELAKKCAEGDAWAIRRMVNCNLRLVVRVAWDYTGRGVPLMDLVQEGSIGLLVAAKKFDYTLDFRFSTYATKWIRQYVTRYIMSHGLIRVPIHTVEKIRKIQMTVKALTADSGTEPTLAQISKVCGLPEEKVKELLQLEPEICSLEVPVGDGDDGTLGQLLENLQAEQPYEKLVREELTHMIHDLVAGLDERQQLLLCVERRSPREQQIMRLRFGICGEQEHTQKEVADRLGISQSYISRLEKRIIRRLREELQRVE
jgi:RNA polymerase primary sigma factor